VSGCISAATAPGGGAPNEDWYGCLPGVVVVLDGVTTMAGMESGCVHGTPWYVRELGTRLAGNASSAALSDALFLAIREVAALHADVCDLKSPGAPSAAAGAIRVSGDDLEWLVLADVSVVIETAAGVEVISDKRVDATVAGLDSGTPRLAERVKAARSAHRNRPGGYWVAADDPAAASHAVTGSAPLADVRRVLVATDGAARLADLFGRSWRYVLAAGPCEVIREVRSLEAGDPECAKWPRIKGADDATAVTWTHR
jgi:hypothetical protein